jgi:hypothetical protein
MVVTLKGSYFSNDLAASGVLSRLAGMPDALPAVVAGLAQATCDARSMMQILDNADHKKLVGLLESSMGDASISTFARQRAVEAMLTIRSDRGQQILQEMASGEHPCVRGSDQAPAGEWELRTDEQRENYARLGLRNMAIRLLGNQKLARRGDLNAAWVAENQALTLKALGAALGAGHRSTRDAAAEMLAYMGTAGTLTLIERYEHEIDPGRAEELARRLEISLSFPRQLIGVGKESDQATVVASRLAAGKVMRVLVQPDRSTAAHDLLRIWKEDADAAVRRNAAVALLELRNRRDYSNDGRNAGAKAWLSDEDLQGLLQSTDPLVAEAAARTFLNGNPFARPLSVEVLRPLLNSPSRVARDLAVRQLLEPRAGAAAGADVVLPLLNSQYPDVASAAAQACFRNEALRRSVGVDSARRIGVLMRLPCIETIAAADAPRVHWSTELPPAPPPVPATPAASATAAMNESSTAATWLWRLTWSTAGLFAVAIAGVGLFTILTVPEPRLAVARAGR